MSLDLTSAESERVRAVLRFLRTRTGGWGPLGKALGFKEGSLANVAGGHRSPTERLAFRLARLAKVPVDDLLSGKFPPEGICPYCGQLAEKRS